MTNGQGAYTRVDMLDRGVIHVPGRTEQDGTRLHPATRNGTQFKTYESFIFGIFHLLFLYCDGPRVTETAERETVI